MNPQKILPSAKLISFSQGLWRDPEEVDTLTELVAYCARVSNPANQMNKETSEKLIRYLIKNKHWSPLEMVSLCVEVTTTRDIARQLLRHRSFSFQEFSQRYADPTGDLGFTTREARMQDPKNRQNSVEITHLDGDRAANLVDEWQTRQNRVITLARETYDWAISQGIAKEQARCVLPEGNTVSRLYVSGTLRSFVHYLDVRLGNGTQKEHREMAQEIAGVVATVFPMILNKQE
jgi:thymidylate synthase (FAD)